MLNTIILFLLLCTAWVILSGFFSPLFLTFGLISASLSLIIARRMKTIDPKFSQISFVWHIPFYLLWLTKEIIVSTWETTKIIWQVDPKIDPVCEWIPLSEPNDIGRVVYANSITLTPGTVSIRVAEDQILVHALSHDFMEGLAKMDQKVTTMAKFGGIDAHSKQRSKA